MIDFKLETCDLVRIFLCFQVQTYKDGNQIFWSSYPVVKNSDRL